MNLVLKSSALLLVALVATACDRPTSSVTAASGEPAAVPLVASTMKVGMTMIDETGVGVSVGFIEVSDGSDGLVLKPDLKALPPGAHGFHVHQNPDCGPKEKDGKMTAGEAAGEHYDPAGTGKHAGPEGAGHGGDLPRLMVAADGTSTRAMTAARLKVVDLMNRSLVIHAQDDNFADAPGGARIACGVMR